MGKLSLFQSVFLFLLAASSLEKDCPHILEQICRFQNPLEGLKKKNEAWEEGIVQTEVLFICGSLLVLFVFLY